MTPSAGWFLIALVLPAQWQVIPVLQNASSNGLMINSWKVMESPARIRAFISTTMDFCLPLPMTYEEHWHCLGENVLYSFMPLAEHYLWVQSTPRTGNVTSLPGLSGEVITNYRNRFESVTVLHSEKYLLAAFWEFKRAQRERGAVLLMSERDTDSFVQQWRYADKTFVLTGNLHSAGGTVLVLTEGTAL